MRVFLVSGVDELELPPGETLIGRSIACRIRFNHPAVSRSHARVEFHDDVVMVEDLASANGTYVNGRRISQKTQLRDGDRFMVGNRELGIRMRARGEVVTDDVGTEMMQRPVVSEPRFVTCPSCRGRVPPDARQCPSCGHRRRRGMRSKTQVINIAPAKTERRRHVRYPSDLPVFYKSESLSLEGMARDLSLSGVFMVGELVDAPGTPCKIALLPDASPALVFDGIVRRQEASVDGDTVIGMGIEFVALTHDDRMTLTRLLMRTQAEARAAGA